MEKEDRWNERKKNNKTKYYKISNKKRREKSEHTICIRLHFFLPNSFLSAALLLSELFGSSENVNERKHITMRRGRRWESDKRRRERAVQQNISAAVLGERDGKQNRNKNHENKYLCLFSLRKKNIGINKYGSRCVAPVLHLLIHTHIYTTIFSAFTQEGEDAERGPPPTKLILWPQRSFLSPKFFFFSFLFRFLIFFVCVLLLYFPLFSSCSSFCYYYYHFFFDSLTRVFFLFFFTLYTPPPTSSLHSYIYIYIPVRHRWLIPRKWEMDWVVLVKEKQCARMMHLSLLSLFLLLHRCWLCGDTSNI